MSLARVEVILSQFEQLTVEEQDALYRGFTPGSPT